MTQPKTHFAVTCPTCRGRCFVDRTLCWQCEGNGRLLIPESAPYRASKSLGRIAVFALVTVVLVLVVMASIR